MTGTLAPWCANEKWTFGTFADGKQWARVEGRQRCPEDLKRNIVWWFRNDYEQQVPDDYMPDDPQWLRELYWAGFRNPLQNYRLFVMGVADRNYEVTVIEGNPDPMTVQRNDRIGPDGQPEQGYQRTLLKLDDGTVRTWASYCSGNLVWYAGYQPTGIYGWKMNFPKLSMKERAKRKLIRGYRRP